MTQRAKIQKRGKKLGDRGWALVESKVVCRKWQLRRKPLEKVSCMIIKRGWGEEGVHE